MCLERRLEGLFGGAVNVCTTTGIRTIGGQVKCSVRSIFSCCFALAMLFSLSKLLFTSVAMFNCVVCDAPRDVFTQTRILLDR